MRKTKEEKDKAFHKIVKCINSCTTSIQTVKCDKLINNFEKLFEKDFPDISFETRVLYEESLAKNVSIIN